MSKHKNLSDKPTAAQLENEIKRVRYKSRYLTALKSTVFTLIAVAAVAVLIATLWLPVLQIYGMSMTPTMENGDIVFSVKNVDMQTGDLVAFYYNNKILVKRVIAKPGETVNITEDGVVYVNDVRLEEPYLVDQTLGYCDIELPYQVPDNRYFVMGDHRSTSIDSHSSIIGCVTQEQIVGRIVFRVWPIAEFGPLK